jgi:hypothetical protein
LRRDIEKIHMCTFVGRSVDHFVLELCLKFCAMKLLCGYNYYVPLFFFLSFVVTSGYLFVSIMNRKMVSLVLMILSKLFMLCCWHMYDDVIKLENYFCMWSDMYSLAFLDYILYLYDMSIFFLKTLFKM